MKTSICQFIQDARADSSAALLRLTQAAQAVADIGKPIPVRVKIPKKQG